MALFAFLVRRDLAARDKQMARMLREEKLGVLQLELANRKVGPDAAQISGAQLILPCHCGKLRMSLNCYRGWAHPLGGAWRGYAEYRSYLRAGASTDVLARNPAAVCDDFTRSALQPAYLLVQVLKMAQLRSFSRAVLFAGTPEQCRLTVEQAEQYRDKLEERGVLLVPLPIYAADGGEGADAEVPALEADDLRCGFWQSYSCICP